MYKNILDNRQQKVLGSLGHFKESFGLVGGTAIALIIGHRRSIDLDLFSNKEFENEDIRKEIVKIGKIEKVIRDEKDHYEIIVNGVRLTFLYYPFQMHFNIETTGSIRSADLITLAAMKAYTLGRRAKWKDYVDLYFILKYHHNLTDIVKKAKQIFKNEFNEKNFRIQLSYFKDIDYSEKVIYSKGAEVKDEIIKNELRKISVT